MAAATIAHLVRCTRSLVLIVGKKLKFLLSRMVPGPSTAGNVTKNIDREGSSNGMRRKAQGGFSFSE